MTADDFPPELMYSICAAVHDAARPPLVSSLDPLPTHAMSSGSGLPLPSGAPSSHPPAVWRAEASRQTLAALCKVNKAWYEAARPWLWRKVEVTLPHAWLALVDQVAGPETDELSSMDVDELQTAPTISLFDQTIRAALPSCPEDRELELLQASLQVFGFPNGSIPPELLSPPASREPSPARPQLRAKSPGRWRLFRTVADAVQNILERAEPGIYGQCFPVSKKKTAVLILAHSPAPS